MFANPHKASKTKLRAVNLDLLLLFERRYIATKSKADPIHCINDTVSPLNINGEIIRGNTTPPAMQNTSTVHSDTVFAHSIHVQRLTPVETPAKIEIISPAESISITPATKHTIKLTATQPSDRIIFIMTLLRKPRDIEPQFFTATILIITAIFDSNKNMYPLFPPIT